MRTISITSTIRQLCTILTIQNSSIRLKNSLKNMNGHQWCHRRTVIRNCLLLLVLFWHEVYMALCHYRQFISDNQNPLVHRQKHTFSNVDALVYTQITVHLGVPIYPAIVIYKIVNMMILFFR